MKQRSFSETANGFPFSGTSQRASTNLLDDPSMWRYVEVRARHTQEHGGEHHYNEGDTVAFLIGSLWHS